MTLHPIYEVWLTYGLLTQPRQTKKTVYYVLSKEHGVKHIHHRIPEEMQSESRITLESENGQVSRGYR